MAKITSLAELTEVADDDLLVVVDKSDTSMADSGTDKKVQKVNLLKGLVPENGWTPAGETWTYVSTDDPTGVIKINANVTSKYSEGMRFKMTNGGNTIYAIITKMGTYGGNEAGYTYITFLHEIDPTDSKALHLMANSAITNPYYSTQKAPQGFPLNPDKWTVTATGGDTNISNPVSGTYYNTCGNIVIPIGVWRLGYDIMGYAQAPTAQFMSVSPAYGTATNNSNIVGSGGWLFGNNSILIGQITNEITYVATSKTTLYLNATVNYAGIADFGTWNYRSRRYARCAYL